MVKKINYQLKELMISLSGACFWYWNSYYSFLDSCSVPKILQKKYPKQSYNKYEVMRNILEELEENNQIQIINNIISNFYKLRNAVDRDSLDEKKAIKLLNEFREFVGDDPIEQEIKKRKIEEEKEKYKDSVEDNKKQKNRINELNNLFIELTTSTNITPQQRGYKLEDLFCDLIQINELDYSRPYKTTDGEQIDGHLKYDKFDYLIEVKWEEGPIKQKDLSIFDGKIRGKAQSTRGLFLSANGFDENAINKFSGDSPRIILITGEDLAIVLSGRVLFYDALKAKVEAIVRYGNINFPLRNI
ncbi:MAG: restriction endonuclease [Spirochaetales bacterium]|nr:restriction endonuclease [Spirochaetales bacterium]